jgi:hypothetical protein
MRSLLPVKAFSDLLAESYYYFRTLICIIFSFVEELLGPFDGKAGVMEDSLCISIICLIS